MRNAASEPQTQTTTVYAELEQFKRRATTLMGSTIALALAVNALLIVVIL
jgi:hypothetical protein